MAAIQPNDVLFGRGGATNQHVGNKLFREIVAKHMPAYLRAHKKDKAVIARTIVNQIQSEGGRFLKRGPDAHSWVQVLDKQAREKTSQALREGLDVRHKTFRTEKLGRSHDSHSSRESARTRPRVVTGVVLDSSSAQSLGGDSSDDGVPELQDERSAGVHEDENDLLDKATAAHRDHLARLFAQFEPPRLSKVGCKDLAEI
jgi:hypothetical protein